MGLQEPERATEGLGGTYFFKDDLGNKVAIVKPCDEEPLAPNNPKVCTSVTVAIVTAAATGFYNDFSEEGSLYNPSLTPSHVPLVSTTNRYTW